MKGAVLSGPSAPGPAIGPGTGHPGMRKREAIAHAGRVYVTPICRTHMDVAILVLSCRARASVLGLRDG